MEEFQSILTEGIDEFHVIWRHLAPSQIYEGYREFELISVATIDNHGESVIYLCDMDFQDWDLLKSAKMIKSYE